MIKHAWVRRRHTSLPGRLERGPAVRAHVGRAPIAHAAKTHLMTVAGHFGSRGQLEANRSHCHTCHSARLHVARCTLCTVCTLHTARCTAHCIHTTHGKLSALHIAAFPPLYPASCNLPNYSLPTSLDSHWTAALQTCRNLELQVPQGPSTCPTHLAQTLSSNTQTTPDVGVDTATVAELTHSVGPSSARLSTTYPAVCPRSPARPSATCSYNGSMHALVDAVRQPPSYSGWCSGSKRYQPTVHPVLPGTATSIRLFSLPPTTLDSVVPQSHSLVAQG